MYKLKYFCDVRHHLFVIPPSLRSLFGFDYLFSSVSFTAKCITLLPTEKTLRAGQLLAVWVFF